MRIALFCPAYPPSDRQGGIEEYAQHLARSLSARGIEVTVIAGDGYHGNGRDGSVHVVRFPGRWGRRWAVRVADELRSRCVDLVNLQYSPAMFVDPIELGWATLASRFPAVVSCHTLWGGPIHNYFAAWRLLRASHAVVATNSEVLYLLRRYLPGLLKKTVYIPIGPNILPHDGIDVHEEAARRYHVSSHTCRLAYFGMAYPGKGLETLLGVGSHLKKANAFDFRLLLIGGGISDVDSYRAEVLRRVSELDLTGEISWTGRIPSHHVSSLLALSDIVILPYEAGASDRRGSLMAALAHGKPIVTTPPRVPIPHFVNGKNMIWPAHASPETLSRAIVRLYEDGPLRKSLGEGALALASTLRWEQIAQDTICLFKKVAHAPTAEKAPQHR